MRTFQKWSVIFSLAATACSTNPLPRVEANRQALGDATPVPATFPAGWQYPAGSPPKFAAQAMVSASSRLAADAGLEIIKAGGNAVDAAVAVGFALAVSYPEAGNIGGGGYMLIRMADGRTAAIDYREIAPRSAFREMYMDSTGRVTGAGVVGRAASGVPGAVAGMAAALARYGSMSLARVMEPAIRMAADGIIVDQVLANSIGDKDSLIGRFAGGEIFLPGGKPVRAGSRLVQPDLAETLRLIARGGPDGFYRGRVAELIAAEMRLGCPAGIREVERAAHGCGIITTHDLESYKPAWRTPLRTTYRGHTLLSMPPSSSGGITVGETLNILEHFPALPRFGTAEYFHTVAAAFQRAFVDRNALLGDPAFITVPIGRLQSKAYAKRLFQTILPDRATPTSSVMAAPRESGETTHYSIVDASGNAVSTTTTLNSLFGSGVLIRGAGFFMNNEMDDFTSQPGVPNQFGLVQGEGNAIAPGKRMLSAMTPTIVLDPRGELLLVVGGRGGPRIITSTAEVILNVIDNRMGLSDAVNAPRIHHQALPDVMRYETGGFNSVTVQRLTGMGYTLEVLPKIGASIVAIKKVVGGYEGTDDPRSSAVAVGY